MTKPWPVPAGLSAELVGAEAAAAFAAEWADLAARAIEPNAFFAPALALAAMRHLPEGRGATLLVAWRGEGETRRLVGALPLARGRGRFLNPAPLRRALSAYGTVSTPLLDPDRPVETLAAMLATLAGAGMGALLLSYMVEDGPVAEALAEALRVGGLPEARLGSHARAFLRSSLPGEQYVRASLETRRRKEADRQRRRLSDEGALAFSVAQGSGDEVAAALEDFLAIEAAGWKGRAGTALKLAPGAASFIREGARRGGRDGSFRVARLTLDGRTIAAGLVLVSGRRAFYAKTAYDEALSRFSPGLLLTLDLTAYLLDDPGIDDADSIAVADHPMIDRIWTARLPVASRLVATRRGGGAAFRAALAIERGRESAVAVAKAKLARLRAWRQPAVQHESKKGANAAAT